MKKEGLQYEMFSGDLVDNRTAAQKRKATEKTRPQQEGMFDTQTELELARTKVANHPMLNAAGKSLELALMMQDERTEEQIATDRMRAAQKQTMPLITPEEKIASATPAPEVARQSQKTPEPPEKKTVKQRNSVSPDKPEKQSGPHNKLTPAFNRYSEIKAQFPQAIVLFRLGDFYEAFAGDAEVIAKELALVLTSRRISKDKRVSMAGMPRQTAENNIVRLIAKGYHVAIYDRAEDKPANGAPPREVVCVEVPNVAKQQEKQPAKKPKPEKKKEQPAKVKPAQKPAPPKTPVKAQKPEEKIKPVKSKSKAARTRTRLGSRNGFANILLNGIMVMQPL